MIPPDVERKIWLGVLIGAAVLGLLFLIWAVFLNRGTILINAKAPFTLTVEGLRTENCTTASCSTAVVPGDYTITIQKPGYESLTKNITVPFGRPYEETVNLQFIPVISETGKPKDELFSPNFQLTKAQRDQLNIDPNTQIFFDSQNKFLCYITRSPTNDRQTLYIATMPQQSKDSKIGEPQIVTTFLRDLQKPVIAPNQAGDKVAAIDQGQAPGQATIYMIDLQAKNRVAIASYPTIRDLHWIQGSNDFIFQARAAASSPESLYLYRWDDGKTIKLSLNTPLENIAIINKNRILAVTDQQIGGGIDGAGLEGALISLLASTSIADISPVHAFVDYSLLANEARLITTLNSGVFPTRVKASTDNKSLFFLQDQKVFQLQFEE